MKHETIAVFVDHNVWEFLATQGIDLAIELPPPAFALCITREAEFELASMPAASEAAFGQAITDANPYTDAIFGFHCPALPDSMQRCAGFDQGRFETEDERQFYCEQRHHLGDIPRKTGLVNNEADLSLAARSFHSIVLTCDKRGPLKAARKKGGMVIVLCQDDFQSYMLGDLRRIVLDEWKKSSKAKGRS